MAERHTACALSRDKSSCYLRHSIGQRLIANVTPAPDYIRHRVRLRKAGVYRQL